ncbi:MAG: molybdopterin-guanine dinucleotide biosynthesis protein [Streptosporangiales bacterium]|nr:molybdopterin-guanine dinucleotide biosynthesis protein [Streptosporangiales bacterium]
MTLTEWSRLCSAELGLDVALEKADVDRILDLARDAAHQVARPAAPLTTFLLGVAVGRGADPADAAARLTELANSQETTDES